MLERMRMGDALALVSDAGTPAVADPGADLAAACAAENIKVFPIPAGRLLRTRTRPTLHRHV
jgi:16S rRNA (cytidine1402-2'-O)-methyltransferase